MNQQANRIKPWLLAAILAVSLLSIISLGFAPVPSAYFTDDFNTTYADFTNRWLNTTGDVSVLVLPSILNFSNAVVYSKAKFFQGSLTVRANTSSTGNFLGFSDPSGTDTCAGFAITGSQIQLAFRNATVGSCVSGTALASAYVDNAYHNYTLNWFYNNTNTGLIQYVQPCLDGTCLLVWRAFSTGFKVPTSGIPITIATFSGSHPLRVDWVAYDPVNVVKTVTTTTQLTSTSTTLTSTSVSTTTTSLTSSATATSTATSVASTSTTTTLIYTSPSTTTSGISRTNTTTSVSTLTSASTTLTTATTTTSTSSTSTTTTSLSVSTSISSSFTTATLLATAVSTTTQEVTAAPWSEFIAVVVAVGVGAVILSIVAHQIFGRGKQPQPEIEKGELGGGLRNIGGSIEKDEP